RGLWVLLTPPSGGRGLGGRRRFQSLGWGGASRRDTLRFVNDPAARNRGYHATTQARPVQRRVSPAALEGAGVHRPLQVRVDQHPVVLRQRKPEDRARPAG